MGQTIEFYKTGTYLINGSEIIPDDTDAGARLRQLGVETSRDMAKKQTITWSTFATHNFGDEKNLKIKFDSLTSHDITYVGIINTARASKMEKFPIPYVMTNCHNSLCAVGGTINEDDHQFAFSAAQKYGGIYVPPHMAVIHSFNRETMAGCGKMILGSDSHTRYGALGTLAIGEGGGELVKQLVGKTYDLSYPEVIGVYLAGAPRSGVGPHDIALSIVSAVFANGFVKNKVMEFVGDGIANLSTDYRNGIDVMTTETACLSSIWQTDDRIREYLKTHGREEDYKPLIPGNAAWYDGMLRIDLSAIEPCIAMPFHPSNVYTIRDFRNNASDILAKIEKDYATTVGIPGLDLKLRSKLHDGDFFVDQAIVAGCSGGIFENIMAVTDILDGKNIGNGKFSMSVYPDSQPVYSELVRHGAIAKLMRSGVVVRSSFCGPCFGAGDTPANSGFSVRHTTRNFPNREGSKPMEGQISAVALMDARSIAATAANGGRLTSADELDIHYSAPIFFYEKNIYLNRVYDGTCKAQPDVTLIFGPNIKDWPEIPALSENLLVKVVCHLTDAVTTTDELIPSGETASFRSDPMRLADFTLSRKDPNYVGRAKIVHSMELARENGESACPELEEVLSKIRTIPGYSKMELKDTGLGSTIYARKPGDGSAREQAASCQRVLGASANLAKEYATKRYRSNLINWGMIPFLTQDEDKIELDNWLFIPDIKKTIREKCDDIQAWLVGNTISELRLSIGELTDAERQILIDGCLINYYRNS